MAEQDLKAVFLNTGEFAGLHKLNDTENIPCVVESETAQGIQPSQRFNGEYLYDTVLHVAASNFPSQMPAQRQLLRVDDRNYTILKADNLDGLYVLRLEARR